ncbi:MAG: hypothetical protein M5U34_09940 [Chloroflexi bacterium]|nr:hypothetical protein [Chloroflexota bacterium]
MQKVSLLAPAWPILVKSLTMPVKSARYDIYCKNGITGWRVAYKLDSDAKTLTLSKNKGSYTIK